MCGKEKDLQEGNFGSVLADKDGEVNSPLQGERWAGAEAQATPKEKSKDARHASLLPQVFGINRVSGRRRVIATRRAGLSLIRENDLAAFISARINDGQRDEG
jgi:hypothetical protein